MLFCSRKSPRIRFVDTGYPPCKHYYFACGHRSEFKKQPVGFTVKYGYHQHRKHNPELYGIIESPRWCFTCCTNRQIALEQAFQAPLFEIALAAEPLNPIRYWQYAFLQGTLYGRRVAEAADLPIGWNAERIKIEIEAKMDTWLPELGAQMESDGMMPVQRYPPPELVGAAVTAKFQTFLATHVDAAGLWDQAFQLGYETGFTTQAELELEALVVLGDRGARRALDLTLEFDTEMAR